MDMSVDLALEVDELRAKLAETMAALQAIRSGEADALVDMSGAVATRAGSEQPYISFFKVMNEGGVTLDTHGVILHANPHFAAMVGRTIESLRGSPFVSCVASVEQSRIEEFLANSSSGICDSLLDAPGKPMPVSISLKKVDTDLFKYQCLVLSDLSERVKAEAEQRIAAIAFEALDGMMLTDEKSFIIRINRAFTKLTGYSASEIVGQTPALLHSGRQNEDFYSRMWEKLKTDKFWQGEIWDKHKDGKMYAHWLSISPVCTPEGEVTHYLGSFSEIANIKAAETALQASEAQFQQIFENSHDAMMLAKPPLGNIYRANKSTLKLFGAADEDAFYILEPSDFSPERQPDGRLSGEKAQEMMAIAMQEGSHFFEWEHKRMDGQIFSADVLLTRMEIGTEIFLQATVRDITERRKAQDEQRIAASAFEVQEGMMITDANSIILRVNSTFTRITGYVADEVVGRNPNMLGSGRHDSTFFTAMWESIVRTGSWDGEIWNRRKDGEIYPQHLTISTVKNSNGSITNYVAAFSDITKVKEAEKAIQELAFFDPLTKLSNRRLLQERLFQALAASDRSGQTGALMFIDLDNFKSINDTLGHAMGDLLLQEVAERLKSCVRAGDTVARQGGDEFVVMLEGLSKEALEAGTQAEATGLKIIDTLNQPYRLGRKNFLNTPSIGITFFKGYQQVSDDLFKQADIAMYQAKKDGRNTLRYFDPKMQEAINARSVLESELRKAIEYRQFQLLYQIQVDHAQRPSGAEVLIRWIHPLREVVSPAEFIPIAEETGLILPIGKWVLETACAQLSVWQLNEKTCNLILSVNVSAKQFRQPDFVKQVQEMIKRYGINPARLKLELTESILLDNIEGIIADMNTLNGTGVCFSLDDFGTGYSSLQYLKRLPLHQLKIDQSFVRDLVEDSSDRAIVHTIIAMAQSLNLEVIAEGVETEEQRQYLENAGCKHYQGYLFGKPMPVKQFKELLK